MNEFGSIWTLCDVFDLNEVQIVISNGQVRLRGMISYIESDELRGRSLMACIRSKPKRSPDADQKGLAITRY